MDRLPDSERSDTWLTYGEQKHHVHLSHAFTTLGDTRLAHVSQERALELSAPTSTMTRTLLNIDAAACSHHDGDTEQACRRTVAALTALPVDYRTGLVRRRDAVRMLRCDRSAEVRPAYLLRLLNSGAMGGDSLRMALVSCGDRAGFRSAMSRTATSRRSSFMAPKWTRCWRAASSPARAGMERTVPSASTASMARRSAVTLRVRRKRSLKEAFLWNAASRSVRPSMCSKAA